MSEHGNQRHLGPGPSTGVFPVVCGGEAPVFWKSWTQGRGPVADGTRACAMEAMSAQWRPLRIDGRSVALLRLTRAQRKMCSLEKIPLCKKCGQTSTLGSPRHIRSRHGRPAPQHEPRIPLGSAHRLSPFKRNTVHLSTEPRDPISRRAVAWHPNIDISIVQGLKWTALHLSVTHFSRL